MLDLYKLKIFVLAAQEGSFSAAAERLLMTQSGVSQHIHELEAQLGTQLFTRGRRGITLTPSGETLLRHAQDILQRVAEAEGAVTDVSQIDSGQVHIGATPGISVYLIPEWMQSFRARYPNLSVSLQTVVTPQIEALLRTQAVDVGFIEGELDEHSQQGIHVVPLEAVEQYVIVGPDHAWWGRGRVDIHALDQQAFIMRQVTSQTRRWLDAELHHYQVRPKITAEFDNLESIKRAVASGTCLTILPEYTVRQEESLGLLQRIPIAAAPLQRTLKAIWWKGNHLSPVTRAFLTHLTRYFPNVGLP